MKYFEKFFEIKWKNTNTSNPPLKISLGGSFRLILISRANNCSYAVPCAQCHNSTYIQHPSTYILNVCISAAEATNEITWTWTLDSRFADPLKIHTNRIWLHVIVTIPTNERNFIFYYVGHFVIVIWFSVGFVWASGSHQIFLLSFTTKHPQKYGKCWAATCSLHLKVIFVVLCVEWIGDSTLTLYRVP